MRLWIMTLTILCNGGVPFPADIAMAGDILSRDKLLRRKVLLIRKGSGSKDGLPIAGALKGPGKGPSSDRLLDPLALGERPIECCAHRPCSSVLLEQRFHQVVCRLSANSLPLHPCSNALPGQLLCTAVSQTSCPCCAVLTWLHGKWEGIRGCAPT